MRLRARTPAVRSASSAGLRACGFAELSSSAMISAVKNRGLEVPKTARMSALRREQESGALRREQIALVKCEAAAGEDARAPWLLFPPQAGRDYPSLCPL